MPIDFRASQIQTNKLIASGSTGTETGAQIVVYSHLADDGTSPNQGFIDQSVFVTSSIGTDIFLYVSGGIGERNVGGAQSITCFGGDVHISGNLTVDGTYPSGGGGGGTNFFWSPSDPYIEASGSLTITGSGYFKAGLSGSLQEVSSGVPYLLAGPNITIATNSLGQVSITGSASGGGGSSFYRLEVLDYYATNNISTTTAGQVIFPANQFTGSLVLYGVIANSDATATGSVRLYNVSSGSYVHIGGPGNQYLSVSGVNPTIVSSVDLISASNFNSSSQAIYELQVSSSNGGSTAFFGGFELRPSGSFTGISYITSSVYNNYISGTWEDGGNKLATTSSVAIAGNLGTGYFSDNVGSDVYFFVSGSSGSKDGGTPGVAVFGGDVVISGVLYGGSPLKIGSSILQNPYNNVIDAGNYNVILASDTNSHVTGTNAERNAVIGASSVAIECNANNANTANRNVVLSSDTVSITTNFNDSTFNSVNASNSIYIDGSGGSSVNGSFFVLVESGSFYTSINSSLAIIATSASLFNGTLAAGDVTNLFSPTLSIIENAYGSAVIAGGPNVISSSDGNPIINSAIIGSNWVVTSSRTYAIGDTVNAAKILMSASSGVDITGDLNVTGSFAVSASGGSNGTLNQYNGLRYYPTIVTSLPYTASLNDYIIAVSASAGPGVELPASEFGRTFVIKDVSGSATTDNVTITAAGGELIDGSPNATIGIDYGSLKFVYFGSGIGWGIV